jgi:hypothetical protein
VTKDFEGGKISAASYAAKRAQLIGTPSFFYSLVLPSIGLLSLPSEGALSESASDSTEYPVKEKRFENGS